MTVIKTIVAVTHGGKVITSRYVGSDGKADIERFIKEEMLQGWGGLSKAIIISGDHKPVEWSFDDDFCAYLN